MFLEKSQVVYLIYNPELNITKIGIASNVNNRFCGLRVASGCDLELYYHSTPIVNAAVVEKIMHRLYEQDRKLGEWYYTDREVLKAKLISTIADLGTNDKVVSQYLHGLSITEIAHANNVTRQAILRKIKALGVEGKQDGEKTAEGEAHHYDDSVYLDIKKEHKAAFLYKKIEPNLYKSEKYYKVSIYAGKKLNDRYFMLESDARKCLAYFKNLKNG